MAPTLTLLIAALILTPLMAIVLMRVASFLDTKKIVEQQIVIDNILRGHVSSLMGSAFNMKENNPTGKLTPEEQEMLRDWAIEQTIESANSLFGKIKEMDHQDLISRVNASVKMFKMHYFSSGMADMQAMQDAIVRGMEDMDED